MRKMTPMRAIRAKCLECAGDSSKEVRLCPIIKCALYPYRFGKRPVDGENIDSSGNEEGNGDSCGFFENTGV